MDRSLNKTRPVLICLVLTVIVSAVYYQVCNFEFLDYDDPEYVHENSNVHNGITPETIKWAFNAGYASNWHPVTWLSHALDWQFFGSDPAGHRITNLVLHIANTLLLFIVLNQMTAAVWPSAFVAALFALHPLHVESVAWIAERKDVLSTFFLMLTIWAYIRFVRRKNILRYILIIVFFALGLMSKPMLVTLPFVLLLLDYWPLGRIGSKRSFGCLFVEKIPLFVMTIASSVITFVAQQKGGAMQPAEHLDFITRLANASISYLRYILKMFWPSRLAIFYPHSGEETSLVFAGISAALLLAITVIVLFFAKKHRYLFTGWFWYLGTLVPVIGIVQVGYQALADRYTYIPLTGLFIIIAWAADELLAKWRYRKDVLRFSALVILSVLAVVTHMQVRYWKDTITLSEHALEVTGNNFKIHFGMALTYLKQGRMDKAIYHDRQALKIIPRSITVWNNLGTALISTGRIDQAVDCFEKAVAIDPCDSEAYLNLCYLLTDKGEIDQAVSLCKKALQANPELNEIRVFLALTLVEAGRFDQAVKEYEDFLSRQPQNAVSHNDFGVVLYQQGQFDKALEHFRRAVQIDPKYDLAKKHLELTLTNIQHQPNKNTENSVK
ncbi:MAG: tetratricopeptide repeat protein [Sedimentisphaerales bacterium]|nr:tetratricopeptide repeat protein [Sedimentisphaerales bacterium]